MLTAETGGPHGGTAWERVIFLTGLILLGALVAETFVIGAVSPRLAWTLAGSSFTEAITGREGGIPIALAHGVPRLLVFQYSATQDLGTAFLVYPPFLRMMLRGRDHDGFLMGRIRRIEDAAARHEAYVRRWGPVGVFLFMLVPFLVNGPLVGLLLGRIAGIRTQNLLLPVVGATVVGSAAWTFFYERTIRVAEALQPGIARWLAAGMVGLILLVGVVDMVRERLARRSRNVRSEG